MRESYRNVSIAAENIRYESETFHRKESALRDQETKLLLALEKMELKESEYHARGRYSIRDSLLVFRTNQHVVV